MARYEDPKQAAIKLRAIADKIERESNKVRWNIRILIQRPKGQSGLTGLSFSNLR
jgi:hypothetical protein